MGGHPGSSKAFRFQASPPRSWYAPNSQATPAPSLYYNEPSPREPAHGSLGFTGSQSREMTAPWLAGRGPAPAWAVHVGPRGPWRGDQDLSGHQPLGSKALPMSPGGLLFLKGLGVNSFLLCIPQFLYTYTFYKNICNCILYIT